MFIAALYAIAKKGKENIQNVHDWYMDDEYMGIPRMEYYSAVKKREVCK